MRAVLFVLLASCSFASVRGPAGAPQPPGDCTTSKLAPTLDLVGAVPAVAGVVLGGALIVAAGNCSASHPPGYNNETCGAAAGLGILLTVPSAIAAVTYGISSYYGYSRVAACRVRRSEAPPPDSIAR